MVIHTNGSALFEPLVRRLAELTGEKPKRVSLPHPAFRFGWGLVKRNGAILFADTVSAQSVRQVCDALQRWGFFAEVCETPTEEELAEIAALGGAGGATSAATGGTGNNAPATERANVGATTGATCATAPAPESGVPEQAQEERFTIRIPRSELSDSALRNLHNLVSNKHTIICRAFGVSDMPIQLEDDNGTVALPWFQIDSTGEERAAYRIFVEHMIAAAKQRRHTRASERISENEKCYFRSFLVSIGLIGPEYRQARAILTSRLSGGGSTVYARAHRRPRPTQQGADEESVQLRIKF